MNNLYIHSMSEMADTILDCLKIAGARDVVEIGADLGGMSKKLADQMADVGGSLTSIDPEPAEEFLRWVIGCRNVRHIPAPSLEAMPGLANVDAWVIDGDHNYYTVRNELAIADQIGQRDGKPLLAILHDVSWPCARRDMYYAPKRIPAEWRQPYSYEGGVTLDDVELVHGAGFHGQGYFAFAKHSGGPRNGVLTAVEDFVADLRTEGRDVAFALIPAVLGLGVVFDSSAPWAPDLAAMLLPFHDNRLIARLEENRLRHFLATVELQQPTPLARAA
ncbi:class I SAM-dependent methyltransferase [Sphingomonas mollis]|uniref:Class I SAM-dependent methyltransferase n=1 Tax=Sphingomonas mollis TaxID=2795726 RepID=A0ABS0XQ08_9SPHN|nr:class I SAM-dependent methyltransferase [Sphingomonas sp. BT553]MBJ6122129.1 class I SAM-dependent methyltransferase [Sphingomonas sp. BT553]